MRATTLMGGTLREPTRFCAVVGRSPRLLGVFGALWTNDFQIGS